MTEITSKDLKQMSFRVGNQDVVALSTSIKVSQAETCEIEAEAVNVHSYPT